MTDDWLHFVFSMFNDCILIWVVWRLMRDQRSQTVAHCLITRENECLLLRQLTILCDACRIAVVASARKLKEPPL